MRRLLVILTLVAQFAEASANKVPVGKLVDGMIRKSTLVEPGGRPFYLKATITDKNDSKSEFNGTVEESWVSSRKWRRVIRLRDFTQTRIVSGDSVFEENIGDYFPMHDEMLADEIVDPLPKPAVDLMNQLGLMATEPGSGQGQCMSEKYFNDPDGREIRVLLAYDCKTGVLIYLWSPTCCYGVMTDYRKFHDKLIAYGTKDDPINIRIDTLRDLDAPDQALFAISQPTPPGKRMTTKMISEAEARKLVIQKTEIKWPAVTKKPTVSSMDVQIVVGRDGRVKEAWSHSPVENSIEDAALTAINEWTFRPQSVDGIPAQIVTRLMIPFPLDLGGSAVPQVEVRPLFDRMRLAGDLRLDGAPGFHMKASFHSEDGATKGSYEETWVSPKKWRREVTLNDTSLLEVQTESAFYRTFPGKFGSRVADDVIDALSFALPGDNGADLHDADWSVVNTKLGSLPVMRLSMGYVNPQGKPDALSVLYFIEEKTGFIRGRYHYGNLSVLNDLQNFGQKSIARRLVLLGGDVKKMEIMVDTLEPEANAKESLFDASGVKPIYISGEEDERFTQPRGIHTPNLSIPGLRGKVSCEVKIDEHGHVREVDFKGAVDEAAMNSIRVALMNWEYEPATINGHPSLGLVQVNVE